MTDIYTLVSSSLVSIEVSFVNLQDVPSPEAISTLHKAEYSQRINVITQRDIVGEHYTFSSLDMGPGGFLLEEVSIQELPTKII